MSHAKPQDLKGAQKGKHDGGTVIKDQHGDGHDKAKVRGGMQGAGSGKAA